jgi:hypothetical protein
MAPLTVTTIDYVRDGTSRHWPRAANLDRSDLPLPPVEEAVAVPTRSTGPQATAPPSVLEEANARRCLRRSWDPHSHSPV